MNERWLTHVVTPEEAGRAVEDILTGPLGVSRRMIQRLTRSRGLRLNGRAPRLTTKVRAGDRVTVRVADAEAPALVPVAMDLDIRYEDADLMVVDKPPFLLVHPTSPSQTATLAHGVAHHLGAKGQAARVRPVHRLDRDTSGLIVIAKTAYAHQHLDRQLRERTLRRHYLAFVEGVPAEATGVIDAPIGRKPGAPNLRCVRGDGEPAVTHFKVVRAGGGVSLLELELETGRTHQIRVHLQHLGHPLVGDRQYGSGRRFPAKRQALHAHRIEFTHPTTGEVHRLEAPLPPDLAALSALLEQEQSAEETT
jgi:23S rRNA pseudouridine1911/1915/1917 synthase